ncbi:MAG: type II 3-dehydroquinate dehydratase [Tissierellia bacterium]|nr:type II 3-dehydroquinate dehydratase [Tissierellia bacterium]
MKILVIHGPNLNVLGKRNPSIYGGKSLGEINKLIEKKAKELGFEVEIFQSNFEGDIVEKIHSAIDLEYHGIIINPAAFSHYSIAIRDAIEILEIPVIEVHLSNVFAREDFRSKSVIAPVCSGQITGLGLNSYLVAMDALKLMIK